MFEDIKQPPDIFADTDKAEDVPPPFRPPQPPSTVPVVPPIVSAPLPSAPVAPTVVAPTAGRKTHHAIVLILAAVVIIAVGAWLSVKILGSRESVTADLDLINQTIKTQEETKASVVSEPKEEIKTEVEAVPEPVVEVDTDKDGLSDKVEAELGTDIASADTDDDGLFDREEAEVYKTNPLNPDTDGDSYRDGDEVKNGYNPNGSGKLFTLPNNE